jgi:cysteine synthase B
VNRPGILDCIGNTPLIEVRGSPAGRCGPWPGANDKVRILAKLEGSNPGGSIKDRAALAMVRQAEDDGILVPGKAIVEATSGNTGIALAMIGAALGYRVVIVMPDSVSLERRSVVMAYGGEVVLTPGCEGTDGALCVAQEIVRKNPDHYVFLNQYANRANLQAHFEATGPEILRQTAGEVDVFVAGMGTSGTIMGIGVYLREHIPGVRIVGVEHPRGLCIQGLKNMDEGCVPPLYTPGLLDEKIAVSREEAYAHARELAGRGIFAGMSSGAAMAGCLKIAADMESGTIVTIFPDRGDRYVTTDLFPSVCGMCGKE